MPDQADRLREIVSARRSATIVETGAAGESLASGHIQELASPRSTRSLLFTSGKGGVGTSNLVLNLAIALGEMDQRVMVLDADIGLANLDLLCGLAPRFDLGDVLASRCRLVDALIMGPGEVQILPGAHAIRSSAEDLGEAPARLVAELAELEADCDFVFVDAGSGLGLAVGMLAGAVDEVIIVSTPEPTSIADAHAAIGRFERLTSPPRLRLLINQAVSKSEAAEVVDRLVNSSRQFQGAVVSPLGSGSILADPHVPMAVRMRKPFLTAFPKSVASSGVRRLARALIRERHPPGRNRTTGFLTAIAARWTSARVTSQHRSTALT